MATSKGAAVAEQEYPQVVEQSITILDRDDLLANPSNPRGKVNAADVVDLAASIRANGILVPLIVRPTNAGYVIVAGHRRWAAAKAVGLGQVPCLVVTADQARDLELGLVENEQRTELDPLAAAKAVEQLLARRGATIDGVAAALGKSRRWVALRARVAKLSSKALRAREKGILEEWPVEWLCEFAVLSPTVQDSLLGDEHWRLEQVGSRADIVALVEDLVCELKDAPWDLADGTLAPRQGKCTTCLRTSAGSPGLFDHDGAESIQTARCLDSACYREKRDAWVGRLAKATREEHGDNLVAVWSRKASLGHSGAEQDQLEKALGQPIAYAHDLEPAKKAEPGAFPVLTVDGPDAGTIRWAKRPRGSARGAKGAKGGAPAKPMSMRELREALERRRGKAAALEARKLVLEASVERVRNDDHLLSLIAAFGVGPADVRDKPEKGQSDAWPALHLGTIPRREALWKALKDSLKVRLADYMMRHDDAPLLLGEICDSLGLPWKTMLAEQTAKIPEPKAWAAREQAAPRAKPKATAKRAGGKRKGAKRGG